MERRHFLRYLGIGAASAGISACGQESSTAAASCEEKNQAKFEWKMVTTWPKNFPGLGTGAEFLAQQINEMSNGRLTVKVYGAGEIVPAFESFDAVVGGTAEMGHGSAYYWKGKNSAFQFFSTVPFGMTANEMNAWLYHGGGMELWQRAYEPFGLEPMPAGNTGVQMGGWFNKEINSLDDLRGLKMRIPGLGGEVLRLAGGTPVNVPGGDLFMSLKNGVIDATEWVGPYNDLAFGLHDAAKYYYSPGWHEPGTTLECIVNKEAMAQLPADLQSIVRNAARVTNANMMLEYVAKNNDALDVLINRHGVEVRSFPDDVIEKLRELSAQVVAEVAGNDAFSQEIYDSYLNFSNKSKAWYRLSEQAYLNLR
ncbi:MAG: TRAP transporter substrate-binding protein [Proteobacteria bacterium]|jgi:TRAP-type mannitol/chloroaromatic compound transport system substrate-binding protein|nr:TRAP transporter substrate-binding protein [Pseudomonadota bacterium]